MNVHRHIAPPSPPEGVDGFSGTDAPEGLDDAGDGSHLRLFRTEKDRKKVTYEGLFPI